jgi:hypothetical protein
MVSGLYPHPCRIYPWVPHTMCWGGWQAYSCWNGPWCTCEAGRVCARRSGLVKRPSMQQGNMRREGGTQKALQREWRLDGQVLLCKMRNTSRESVNKKTLCVSSYHRLTFAPSVPSTLYSCISSTHQQHSPSHRDTNLRATVAHNHSSALPIAHHRWPGNGGKELHKIIPRYRTFQYRKCLGVLHDGSQEGEHDREIRIQSRWCIRGGAAGGWRLGTLVGVRLEEGGQRRGGEQRKPSRIRVL